MKRPFKLPAASVLAPVAFIVTNLMVFFSGFAAIELVVPLDLAGIVLLVFYNRYTKTSGVGYLYGIYMPVYLVFTLIYSYLSSFGPKHLIP